MVGELSISVRLREDCDIFTVNSITLIEKLQNVQTFLRNQTFISWYLLSRQHISKMECWANIVGRNQNPIPDVFELCRNRKEIGSHTQPLFISTLHTIYMHVSSSLMSVLASQVSMQGKQVWDFDNFQEKEALIRNCEL